MIQSFREKLSGVIAIAIIILIAIPLAFFGVDSLFLNSNRISDVGSVNGRDISEVDYSRAVASRENQIQQLLGDNYSPDLVDTSLIESAALSGLVDLYLFLTHAEDNAMGATEAYVAKQIQQIPQFQVNGEFSDTLFSNYIYQFGFTASTFISALGEELVSNQLRAGLQTSSIATEQVLAKSVAILQERRSYQTLLLPVNEVLESVELSDEEISVYYEENTDLFTLPERISLDYVQLSPTDFIEDVEVSDAEVQARFSLVLAAMPARRQAAHILIEIQPEDAHLPILDEIQLKIEDGAEFEALAAEYSADIGSSESGGLLGYTDGNSFPEEFEAALSELEVGEISAPVLTDAGLHIIKLVNLDRETLVFEEESERLEAEIRLGKAGDVYRQNLERLRDASFSTDDLTQLIADFASLKQLEVLTTNFFSRDSGEDIAANEAVRAIGFSDIVLQDRLNSEVIELGDSSVVVHLREYLEPGVAALSEVQDQIIQVLTRQKGTELLEARARAIQARLEAGEEVEDVARDEDIEWQVQLDALRGTGGSAGQAIFSAPVSGELPLVGSDIQPNGDYLIYSIDEVASGSLDDFNDAQLSQLATQLSQVMAASEGQAYLNTLRSSADIDFKIDVDYE